MLRAVVVDDEELARERVRSLVESHSRLALVGEASDGAGALDLLVETRPDVVFLDIEMPELDGFEVLAALDADIRPRVVFVTAYDQFAIDAFEAGALDYLLKPVTEARFAATVERLTGVAEAGAPFARVRDVALDVARRRGWQTRFVGCRGRRHYFIPTADVEWIESDGNYLRLHIGKETHLVRGTMKSLETRLDPERFVRIHRSVAVSIDGIASIESNAEGEYRVTMRSGRILKSSRGYAARVRGLLRP